MSTINFTTKVLGIKDKNISFSNEIEHVVRKGVRHTAIAATLSYVPEACPVCGTVNENFTIIKNGAKISNIKLLPINGEPAFLRVKKQRFLCKSCGHSFSAQTDIVEKNCFISRKLKLKILDLASEKVSVSFMAKETVISTSTVARTIDNCFKYFKPAKNYLPKHLMFDEFKSVKNVTGCMSFIYADAESHEIIDIVEDRKLYHLRKYFQRFTPSARRAVQTVCMDMYSPYISLVKEMFPNAAIVFDRFHIIQLLSRVLIKTRIDEMSKFNPKSMEYKRLKRYWKLIQRDSMSLNSVHFRHYTHFKYFVSEQTVVNESIAVSPILKATYDAYQMLLSDIRNRRSDLLIAHLKAFLAEKGTLSAPMVKSLKTLLLYQDEVRNALNYSYSNGPIEGVNNYIKVLKRISFGYRSFVRIRNRILITHNLLKAKREYQAA